MPREQAFRRADHAHRADRPAAVVEDGGRDAAVADVGLLVLHREPLVRDDRQRLADGIRCGTGTAGQRPQRGRHQGVDLPGGHRRHDRLAECARVPRDRRADLEDLHGVVRPELVVHHHHGVVHQHRHPDRLVDLAGQRTGPQHRTGPQLGAGQVGVAELQHAGAERVAAGRDVLADQAALLQRAQQAVHGRLGQVQPGADLGHAEGGAARAELVQDPRRAVDRLDHAAPLVPGPHPRADSCSASSNTDEDRCND
jgi:hypothetical protein